MSSKTSHAVLRMFTADSMSEFQISQKKGRQQSKGKTRGSVDWEIELHQSKAFQMLLKLRAEQQNGDDSDEGCLYLISGNKNGDRCKEDGEENIACYIESSEEEDYDKEYCESDDSYIRVEDSEDDYHCIEDSDEGDNYNEDSDIDERPNATILIERRRRFKRKHGGKMASRN